MVTRLLSHSKLPSSSREVRTISSVIASAAICEHIIIVLEITGYSCSLNTERLPTKR